MWSSGCWTRIHESTNQAVIFICQANCQGLWMDGCIVVSKHDDHKVNIIKITKIYYKQTKKNKVKKKSY